MCFFFLSFSASSWASFLFSSSWKSFKLIVINQFLASFEATFSSFSLGGSFSGSSLFKRPGNHANWSLKSEKFLQALLIGGWFLVDCWWQPVRLAPLKDGTLPDTLSETTLERSPIAMLVELYQVRFPLVCMKTPQDSQCHLFHSPLPALWYGRCWGLTRLRWSLLVCLATCCVQELWGRPQPRTSPCLSLETGL